jgi:hypothetical protein
VHSGSATWFTQNGVAGACGTVHQDSDFIVALDSRIYGTYWKSGYCGKSIVITEKSTGKTATATVADECPTCDSDGSIDMSVALFKHFQPQDVGMFDVTWQFA